MTHASILAADVAGFWTAFIGAVVIRHAMGGEFLLADYARLVPMVLGFTLLYAAAGLYPGVGLHPVRELNSVVYLAMMAGTFLSKPVASSPVWLSRRLDTNPDISPAR